MIDGADPTCDSSGRFDVRARATEFFLFLGIACAGEKCGLLAHGFSILLSASAIAAAFLFERSMPDARATSPSIFEKVKGAASLLLGAFFYASPLHLRGLAVTLLLFGAASAAIACRRRRRPIFESAAIVAVVVAFLDRLTAVDLLARHLADAVAISATSAVGRAFGVRIEIGWSMSGIPLLLLAITTVVFSPGNSRRRSLASAILEVFLLVLTWALVLGTCALLPRLAASDDESLRRFSGILPPPLWNAATAVSLGLAVALIRRTPASIDAYVPEPRSGKKAAVAATIAAIGILVAAPPRFSPSAFRPLRITLYEKGLVNWIAPTKDVHGPGSLGMFGMLSKNLRAFGHTAQIASEVDEKTLSQTDVLVVINQIEPFDRSVVEGIERFVEGGGGLIVLGDHTADWGRGFQINQPLEKSAIRFNFDNAEFFIGGWLGSYRYFPHEMTAGMDDDRNEASSVIGASLDVRYPAVPLVVGRYGWSEPGDPANQATGFMGNRRFDGMERVGDVCLVAAQEIGRGRIVCFGDTSAFTNGLLTNAWPFVMRVIAYAGGTSPGTPGIWRSLLAIVLVLCGIAGSVGRRGLAPSWVIASAGLSALYSFTLAQAAAATPLVLPRPSSTEEAASRPRVALIDASHFPSVSFEGIGEDGLGGLGANLLREGYVELNTRNFDPTLFLRADLVVVCSPTKRYAAHEVDMLAKYAEAGGALLLAAGWPDREPIRPLLDRFGFAIENVPLGNRPGECVDRSIRPQFWNAWECAGGTVVARVFDRGTVVQKPFGQGRVILIADSHFLRDKSLESNAGINPENIRFLGYLLQLLRDESDADRETPAAVPTKEKR